MTEETRRNLAAIWQRNELAIAEALSLKAGELSPVERLEALEKEQDEIEADLAGDWLRKNRAEREAE